MMGECCNCMGYHEQNLDWFLSEIKKALAEWDVTEKEWAETKAYITNYFNNLDISKEVSDKINEMAEDGTLAKIINQTIFTDLESNLNNYIAKYDGQNTFLSDMQKGGKNVLMIGDSIGAGYGWNNTSDRTNENDGVCAVWRTRFPQNTIDNLSKNECTISNLANPSNYLKLQIDAMSTEKTYDYIFIMCGINDVTKGIIDKTNYLGNSGIYLESLPSENYEKTYMSLFSSVKLLQEKQPNASIYFILEPSSGENRYLYDSARQMYKEICKTMGIVSIDAYSVFSNHNNSAKSLLYKDQFHPSETGYKLLEKIVTHGATYPTHEYFNPFTNLLFVDTDLSIIAGVGSYTDVLVSGFKIVSDICRSFILKYICGGFVITDGKGNFVTCNLKFNDKNVYFVELQSCKVISYRVGYKVYIDPSTAVTILEDNSFLNASQKWKALGVTKITDIPISGCFDEIHSDFTDAPGQTGGIMHITSFCNYRYKNNTLYYQKLYFIKNFPDTNKLYLYYVEKTEGQETEQIQKSEIALSSI